MDAHDARAQAGPAHLVTHDLSVILFENQAFEAWLGDPISAFSASIAPMAGRPGKAAAAGVSTRGRSYSGALEASFDKGRSASCVAVNDQEAILDDGFADDGKVQIPLFEDRAGDGLFPA